jgi:hypothetical protein
MLTVDEAARLKQVHPETPGQPEREHQLTEGETRAMALV